MADHPRTLVDVTADDALGSDDVTALLARIGRREVNGTELREAAVARVRAANDHLNAVTCWVQEPAPDCGSDLAEAPLAGIPTVIKDNEDLAGYNTTQGSWAMPDRPAPACSPWVAQYLRLGFVPVAKTTMPEFGLTATTETRRFGATRNPWDTTRSTGGSSGGSAALVASGAIPVAHANDGGGRSGSPQPAAAWWGSSPAEAGSSISLSWNACRCTSPSREC